MHKSHPHAAAPLKGLCLPRGAHANVAASRTLIGYALRGDGDGMLSTPVRCMKRAPPCRPDRAVGRQAPRATGGGRGCRWEAKEQG